MPSTPPPDCDPAEPSGAELPFALRELPGEVRLVLARSAHTPEAVGYLADAMEHTLAELGGDSSARHLREQASALRAQIGRATCLLLELQNVAGQLEGLAWTVQAQGAARAVGQEPE